MITSTANITTNAFSDFRQQQAERTATRAERQAERLQQEADEKRQEARELESEADRLGRDADRQETRAQVAQQSIRATEVTNALDKQIRTVVGSLEKQTGAIINTEA